MTSKHGSTFTFSESNCQSQGNYLALFKYPSNENGPWLQLTQTRFPSQSTPYNVLKEMRSGYPNRPVRSYKIFNKRLMISPPRTMSSKLLNHLVDWLDNLTMHANAIHTSPRTTPILGNSNNRLRYRDSRHC